MAAPSVVLEGQVVGVVYAADDGYRVVRLRAGGNTVTVVGRFERPVAPGEWIAGEFEPSEHPRYGRQYRLRRLKQAPHWRRPVAELVGEWLGVDPEAFLALARDDPAARVAARLADPLALWRVLGDREAAGRVARDWGRLGREGAVWLALVRTPWAEAWSALETRERKRILENPYRAVWLMGMPYPEAEAIAREAGYDDPAARARAAAVAALYLAGRAGHTAPDGATLEALARRLGPEAPWREGLGHLVADGTVRARGDRYALALYAEAEEAVWKVAAGDEVPPTPLSLRPPPGLTDEQARLFAELDRRRLVILHGLPGTGKTRTVSALAEALSARGIDFAMAAPTGKAARRITEASGLAASTLHRLLSLTPEDALVPRARRLGQAVVIVDECSMIDSLLMRQLVGALAPGARLVLVGDPNQLPPVGPGQPFADLVARRPSVALTRIFRQAAENPIVAAAHAIHAGRVPEFPEGDARLVLHDIDDPGALADAVIERFLAEAARGTWPALLTPTHKGPLGTRALNARLKAALNPGQGPSRAVGARRTPVHAGDPLVAVENDYQTGLMNGEVVRVAEVADGGLVLERGEERIRVGGPALFRLELAYALTYHRYQGSQAPLVFLVLHHDQPLLSRELLYTGLTRAEARVELFATRTAIARAVRTRMAVRQTWMATL